VVDITSTLQALSRQGTFNTIDQLSQIVRPSDAIAQAIDGQNLKFYQFPNDPAPHRFSILQGTIRPWTAVSGTGSVNFDPTGASSVTPYFFNKAYVLPLPTLIQDSKSVQYNRNFNWAKALGGALSAVVGAGNLSYLEKIAGAATGLGEGLGYAVNNFKALTITQPEFRTFNLEFRLFPKTLEESRAIQKIITTIQTGMHPELDGFGIAQAFKFPDIFMCFFSTGQTGADGAAYLYKFKPAVIAGMSVNYQGDAPVPAFYRDPTGQAIPESVIIRMGFIELEVWTRQNYLDSVDQNSGLYDTNPLSALNRSVK